MSANLHIYALNSSQVIILKLWESTSSTQLQTPPDLFLMVIRAAERRFSHSSNFPENTIVYCTPWAPVNMYHTWEWSHRSPLSKAGHDGKTLSPHSTLWALLLTYQLSNFPFQSPYLTTKLLYRLGVITKLDLHHLLPQIQAGT